MPRQAHCQATTTDSPPATPCPVPATTRGAGSSQTAKAHRRHRRSPGRATVHPAAATAAWEPCTAASVHCRTTITIRPNTAAAASQRQHSRYRRKGELWEKREEVQLPPLQRAASGPPTPGARAAGQSSKEWTYLSICMPVLARTISTMRNSSGSSGFSRRRNQANIS